MNHLRSLLHNGFVWVIVAVAVVATVVLGFGGDDKEQDLTLTKFNSLVDNGKVKTAELRQSTHLITGTATINGKLEKYKVTYVGDGETVVDRLEQKGAKVKAAHEGQSLFVSLISALFPLLLLLGVFLFVVNRVNGGGNKLMQFGRAKTRMMSKDQPKISFKDVAGAQEAIADLEEIKDFLESPDRFLSIGAKIPKGVLLYGPPGTGKTLLARAVAGEAGVPFFSISGSDFVEMFVGVGASRVRDLFEQAKAAAPAIIFMDEIDAVGRHRGAGIGGGNDEREQTLNQLLVEMDGFDATTGVIMIAATNRPDVLDPALLRPGRFDRQIVVDKPDLEGRTRILEVHAKDKPLADDVRLDVLSKRTPGFTGADLANLLNEAALLAARHGLQKVEMKQMEEAIDRVIAGPERATRVMSDKEKKIIAFHEGGHAVVGHVLPDADPVHKVSIVARGRALGWTLALPSEDKYLHSRRELEAQLAVLLGGRTAEELIFDEPTTGASNDIEKATSIARAMVTDYGMSNVVGPLKLNDRGAGDQYLGGGGGTSSHSDEVAARIDAEVRAIVEQAHDEARRILTTHRELLDRLAAELIEKETVDQTQFNQLMGEPPIWPSAEPPPAETFA